VSLSSTSSTRSTRGSDVVGMTKSGSIPSLMVAGYAITMKGVAGFDPRDVYHLVVALSWPRFLVLTIGAELLMNAAFALLYLARPAAIANVRPGSFADAFFFSVETSATVGYGDMHPVTLYGHIVCTVEIFSGIALTALATGLLFVRFSHPRPRIGYAKDIVVARHQDDPTLMIRVVNLRRTVLYDAVAHLTVILSIPESCGQVVRRVHELQLARPQLPLFALAWTLRHRIDETSPLNGYDVARMKEHDGHFWLSMEARDITTGAQVIDTKEYSPAQVAFGMRYAEILSIDAAGNAVADLSAVSRIEHDIGPEPLMSGWDDRS
jgi:inward rectifier potassium channel